MSTETLHHGELRRSSISESSFSPAILRRAAWEAVRKLDPRQLLANPVILTTEAVAALSTVSAVLAFRGTNPIRVSNWVSDAVVKLVECGEYTGRVHHGFSSTLQRTWRDVEPMLALARDKPCSSPAIRWAAHWRCLPPAASPGSARHRRPFTPSAHRGSATRRFVRICKLSLIGVSVAQDKDPSRSPTGRL